VTMQVDGVRVTAVVVHDVAVSLAPLDREQRICVRGGGSISVCYRLASP
jgi:hypothetical protein